MGRIDIPWVRVLAEGAVIVLSILLAFGIDAWWDGRLDREREQEYLQLLSSDLQGTLENNQRFSSLADPIDQATARLVRAYYEAELPPTDSLALWFGMVSSAWMVQPRLGTVQALAASGDMVLVRDGALRTSIQDYSTTMLAFDAWEQMGAERFANTMSDLSEHVDLIALVNRIATGGSTRSSTEPDPMSTLPSGPSRELPVMDVEALVLDPSVHRILGRALSAKQSMRTNRERMRSLTERFLAQVNAAMGT